MAFSGVLVAGVGTAWLKGQIQATPVFLWPKEWFLHFQVVRKEKRSMIFHDM